MAGGVALVGGIDVVGKDVEHFFEAGEDALAVLQDDGVFIEIGGEVGLMEGAMVVTIEDDFGHDIGGIAKVSSFGLGAKIVEKDSIGGM